MLSGPPLVKIPISRRTLRGGLRAGNDWRSADTKTRTVSGRATDRQPFAARPLFRGAREATGLGLVGLGR